MNRKICVFAGFLVAISLAAGSARAQAVSSAPDFAPRPRVAEGAAFALAVDGSAKRFLGEFAGDMKEEALRLPGYAAQLDRHNPLASLLFRMLDKSGPVEWAVVSYAFPRFKESGDLRERMPEFAVAVCARHDQELVDDAIAEIDALAETVDPDSLVEEFICAGRRAWALRVKELSDFGFVPSAASLDNRIILVCSTPNALEKQIGLYTNGQWANAKFSDFRLGSGDIARFRAVEIGRNIKRYVPNTEKFFRKLESQIPGFTEIGLGAGNLEARISERKSGAKEFAVALATAKPQHAALVSSSVKLGVFGAAMDARRESQRAFARNSKNPEAKILLWAAEVLETAKVEDKGTVAVASLVLEPDAISRLAGVVEETLGELVREATSEGIGEIRGCAGKYMIESGMFPQRPSDIPAVRLRKFPNTPMPTTDIWGRELRIVNDRGWPLVVSDGPDGKPGTDDDTGDITIEKTVAEFVDYIKRGDYSDLERYSIFPIGDSMSWRFREKLSKDGCSAAIALAEDFTNGSVSIASIVPVEVSQTSSGGLRMWDEDAKAIFKVHLKAGAKLVGPFYLSWSGDSDKAWQFVVPYDGLPANEFIYAPAADYAK